MTLSGIFWVIARTICYIALVVVVLGWISLIMPFVLGFCSNQSGGTIKCDAPFYRSIFEFGFTVVMLSIFTGVPALLAIGGLIFGIVDVRRWWRN